jgi:uncharacterized protein HemX
LDIVAILEVLGSVVLGGGLLEFIKWLYNRKTDKKAAEQKIKQDEENSTIDNWEKLSDQHEQDIEYYRSQLKDANITISEKEHKIEELTDQINCLTSSITQAQMLRCDVVGCERRQPPFGFKRINFRTGEVEA